MPRLFAHGPAGRCRHSDGRRNGPSCCETRRSRLLADFGGEAANLLEDDRGPAAARGWHGAGGYPEPDTPAIRDPHFKKGFMLVKTLESLGLYRVLDRENLFIPVDYHLMRVALRGGMVETPPAVADQLRARRPASEELDEAIRGAVKRAYKIVENGGRAGYLHHGRAVLDVGAQLLPLFAATALPRLRFHSLHGDAVFRV